jgi:RimJ/RimL family protein N-acetyltransferase
MPAFPGSLDLRDGELELRRLLPTDRDAIVELAIVVDGTFVGATHLAFYDDWRASVAYWLAPEARGRGYVTRAVRLVTRWGFETFESLNRIELWSIVGNEASDAVARRAGFTEEGVLRSRFPARGEYKDVRCFSLLRED